MSIIEMTLSNKGRIFSLDHSDIHWSNFKKNFSKSYDNSSHEAQKYLSYNYLIIFILV